MSEEHDEPTDVSDDPADFAVPTDEDVTDEEAAVVVAVTDDPQSVGLDEEGLADLVESHREELDHSLADLQQELAGMARTGIPGVDEALDQLSALDPNDLQGSSQLLADVLAKLESVMSEAPQE